MSPLPLGKLVTVNSRALASSSTQEIPELGWKPHYSHTRAAEKAIENFNHPGSIYVYTYIYTYTYITYT